MEAIVQLISEDKKEATYDEVMNEMIANAWYSVVEFQLKLSGIWAHEGRKDSLENAVRILYELSALSSNVSKLK